MMSPFYVKRTVSKKMENLKFTPGMVAPKRFPRTVKIPAWELLKIKFFLSLRTLRRTITDCTLPLNSSLAS